MLLEQNNFKIPANTGGTRLSSTLSPLGTRDLLSRLGRVAGIMNDPAYDKNRSLSAMVGRSGLNALVTPGKTTAMASALEAVPKAMKVLGEAKPVPARTALASCGQNGVAGSWKDGVGFGKPLIEPGAATGLPMKRFSAVHETLNARREQPKWAATDIASTLQRAGLQMDASKSLSVGSPFHALTRASASLSAVSKQISSDPFWRMRALPDLSKWARGATALSNAYLSVLSARESQYRSAILETSRPLLGLHYSVAQTAYTLGSFARMESVYRHSLNKMWGDVDFGYEHLKSQMAQSEAAAMQDVLGRLAESHSHSATIEDELPESLEHDPLVELDAETLLHAVEYFKSLVLFLHAIIIAAAFGHEPTQFIINANNLLTVSNIMLTLLESALKKSKQGDKD